MTRPQPEHAADGGEQEALDQLLLEQPPASRAKCGTHGRLALAADGARQQQVRDVGAHDQQHQADQEQQHPERTAVVGADGVEAARGGVEVSESGSSPAARVTPSGTTSRWKLLVDPLMHGGRHRHRAAAARSAGPTSTSASLGLLRARRPRVSVTLRGQRREDVHPLADGDAEEPWRRDTDDRRNRAVDAERTANDVGAAAEHPLPQPVADHDHDFASDAVVVGRQRPPEQRRDAEARRSSWR